MQLVKVQAQPTDSKPDESAKVPKYTTENFSGGDKE